MPQFPKFEQRIKDSITTPASMQASTSGYGIIMDYNSAINTATVMMAAKDSDNLGDTFRDVPCPVLMGVNLTAPEVGRPCWVDFKDNNTNRPFITHYFNFNYDTVDYPANSIAINNTPRYLYQM